MTSPHLTSSDSSSGSTDTDRVAVDLPPGGAQLPSPRETFATHTTPRGVLPAPSLALSAVDEQRFVRPVHAVPVLLFHQICPVECAPNDIYGMTQAELQRTLLMLKASGYATISSAEYVRYLNGDWSGLPATPIYVTFDDGRLDAYRGADDVLRVTGTKATMFVITAHAESNNPAYMSWSEITAADASGRWDIQLHAHAGHSRMPTRLDRGVLVEAPFFANRRYDPVTYVEGDHLEPKEVWRARVEVDITTGLSLLKEHIPNFQPYTFAVPFGDYGQKASNDPELEGELRSLFGSTFAAWFTQPSANPDFNVTSTPSREQPRFTIRNTTTADSVYTWLRAREASRARTPSL